MSETLEEVAAESDRMTREAREKLVAAVRQAHRDGMSQREIARRIGRSQPEVSRLIRFHGTGPLARKLRAHRDEVIRIIEDAGGSNVRVFGSVATGKERDGSDIDLLADLSETDLSLLGLERLQHRVAAAVGVPVELTPDSERSATLPARPRPCRSEPAMSPTSRTARDDVPALIARLEAERDA